MSKYIKSVSISTVVLFGCASNLISGPYGYTGAEKDPSKLAKIETVNIPGSGMKMGQYVLICGVDKVDSVKTNLVYVLPGEHEICGHVSVNKDGSIIDDMFNQNVKFKAEAGKTYKFNVVNTGVSYIMSISEAK